MAPEWAQLPLVGLATAATVIASQAVITGAYSLSRQAIQLGLLPRLEIRHTSEAQAGPDLYPAHQPHSPRRRAAAGRPVPHSGALAGAYGIAVSGTMVVTAILAFVVVWKAWKWDAALGACWSCRSLSST